MSYPLNVTIPNPLFRLDQPVYAANKGEESHRRTAKIINRKWVYQDYYGFGVWVYTVWFDAPFQSQEYLETTFEKVGDGWYVRRW